ncbi:NAD(P)H-dependent glycerol-3-phosphate dehydrogenase [Gemmatimonadota bacterium]
MRITVLGAGSWGTALAVLLDGKGYPVRMWEFFPELAGDLARTRMNEKMLPGIPIPESILITSDIGEALKGAEVILFVVPTVVVRSTAESAAPCIEGSPLIVNAAKGIEQGTTMRVSEILGEILPERFRGKTVTLSGPSHAEEVSRGIPTTVVAASPDAGAAALAPEIFSTSTLRVYTNPDQVGVELAGSLKNVIAVAAGVLDGLGYGDNTRGALMTRGLVEISRLGRELGADPLTFAGLSGMGDLITTCISRHSRNRFVGERIGRGKSLEEVLSGMVMVAEGVNTVQSARELAVKVGVEMPITEAMYEVLFEGRDPGEALLQLMTRELKPELEHHRGR